MNKAKYYDITESNTMHNMIYFARSALACKQPPLPIKGGGEDRIPHSMSFEIGYWDKISKHFTRKTYLIFFING